MKTPEEKKRARRGSQPGQGQLRPRPGRREPGSVRAGLRAKTSSQAEMGKRLCEWGGDLWASHPEWSGGQRGGKWQKLPRWSEGGILPCCPQAGVEVQPGPHTAGLGGFLSDIFTSLGRRRRWWRWRRPRGRRRGLGDKRKAAARRPEKGEGRETHRDRVQGQWKGLGLPSGSQPHTPVPRGWRG